MCFNKTESRAKIWMYSKFSFSHNGFGCCLFQSDSYVVVVDSLFIVGPIVYMCGGGGGDGGVVFGTYFEIQYLESILFLAFTSLRRASL